MAQAQSTTPLAPVTPDAFMATRTRFWGSFTKFTTNVAIGLAIFLALLWYFLV